MDFIRYYENHFQAYCRGAGFERVRCTEGHKRFSTDAARNGRMDCIGRCV